MDTLRTGEQTQAQQIERVELAVSRLLRLGTSVAAILMAAGLLLLLAAPTAIGPELITAGLITLVCTPLLRVAAAFIIYLRLGDLTYAVISLGVLAIVFAGILLGQTH